MESPGSTSSRIDGTRSILDIERVGDGFDVSIDEVPYEFQRGGNQMIRIRNVILESLKSEV